MSDVVCTVPGDKSLTHRALIFSALAEGTSTVRHPLLSEDTRATMRVLRELGVQIDEAEDSVTVHGVGGDFRSPSGPLDCGNSGTTARLMTGVLAGAGVVCTITGDDSLRARPSQRVVRPLVEAGAEIETPAGEGFPVRIVRGISADIRHRSPVASAQVKSALLLAGLAGRRTVEVTEPVRSRDHTEKMLRALGVSVTSADAISLQPGPVSSFDFAVPGDPSSAAFLLAAGLLHDRAVEVSDVLLNETRTGFLNVLGRMGASNLTRVEEARLGEPVGVMAVSPSDLRGCSVGAVEVPALVDEIPILAVVAARATGVTRFEGVGELRVKESDRLARLEAGLGALGVTVRTDTSSLEVVGPGGVWRPAAIETGRDHRIAMAFAVLGSHPDVELTLSETASTHVSFPGFFEALDAVTPA